MSRILLLQTKTVSRFTPDNENMTDLRGIFFSPPRNRKINPNTEVI